MVKVFLQENSELLQSFLYKTLESEKNFRDFSWRHHQQYFMYGQCEALRSCYGLNLMKVFISVSLEQFSSIVV